MSVTEPPIDFELVAERTASIRAVIEKSAPDPSAVRLVAVTKGFGSEAVRAALAAGIGDIGENYADELVRKADVVGGHGELVRWHFLGGIQRNKVRRLAPVVGCWQGVARIEEGQTISAHSPGATVLVQLDITGLPGRSGCALLAAPDLVDRLQDLDLDVAGLMAVGPPGDPEDSRQGFQSVSRLADRLGLPVRSMGMSADLRVALAEGSTMVRIGRALFGCRPARG